MQHIVRLPASERQTLRDIVSKGTHPARVILRAQILLRAHESMSAGTIARELRCGPRTVTRVRKRYCTGGLDRALHDAPRSGKPPTFTGVHEAQIVALACSDAPDGASRWTLKLLAEKARENGIVEKISPQAVWLMLEKQDTKPWLKKNVVRAEADTRVQGTHGRPARPVRQAV